MDRQKSKGSIVRTAFQVGMERILVKSGRQYRLIPIDDIQWVEAQGNYLRIHLREGSLVVRHTLSSIEAKLNPRLFVRINRSTIVRVDQIRELRSLDGSGFHVVMDDRRSWKWGRRYRHNLDRLLIHGSTR